MPFLPIYYILFLLKNIPNLIPNVTRKSAISLLMIYRAIKSRHVFGPQTPSMASTDFLSV